MSEKHKVVFTLKTNIEINKEHPLPYFRNKQSKYMHINHFYYKLHLNQHKNFTRQLEDHPNLSVKLGDRCFRIVENRKIKPRPEYVELIECAKNEFFYLHGNICMLNEKSDRYEITSVDLDGGSDNSFYIKKSDLGENNEKI